MSLSYGVTVDLVVLPVFLFSVSFHLMCVHINFSSVQIAERPPFGKELLIPLSIFSQCILTFCNFSYFPFGFEEGIWVLIAVVPHRRLNPGI